MSLAILFSEKSENVLSRSDSLAKKGSSEGWVGCGVEPKEALPTLAFPYISRENDGSENRLSITGFPWTIKALSEVKLTAKLPYLLGVHAKVKGRQNSCGWGLRAATSLFSHLGRRQSQLPDGWDSPL